MYYRSNFEIEDFLLFSGRVYDRMFVLHNEALWPWHTVTFAIGLLIVFAAIKRSAQAATAALILLGACWLFVAVSFFYLRYAMINWAAVYLAPIIALMAPTLWVLAAQFSGGPSRFEAGIAFWAGMIIILVGLAGYPLLAAFEGTRFGTSQFFGIAPDPTAVVTLGFLTLCRGRLAAISMIIPILWLAITGLTLYALGRDAFVLAPLIATLSVLFKVFARQFP